MAQVDKECNIMTLVAVVCPDGSNSSGWKWDETAGDCKPICGEKKAAFPVLLIVVIVAAVLYYATKGRR